MKCAKLLAFCMLFSKYSTEEDVNLHISTTLCALYHEGISCRDGTHCFRELFVFLDIVFLNAARRRKINDYG